MSAIFPSNDFERKGQLVKQLGSFWSGIFDDAEFISDREVTLLQESRQTYDIARENLLSISRFTIPVYNKEEWLILSIDEADMQIGRIVESGNSYSFEENTTVADPVFAFPLRSDIKEVGSIVDEKTNPNILLINSVDYFVDAENSLIVFKSNPFLNNSLKVESTYSSQGVEEQSIIKLWMNKVYVDKNRIYSQFGYVISLWLKSSAQYRDILNYIFDNLMFGNSHKAFIGSLALMADCPISLVNNEVVEDIVYRSSETLIITDRNVYKAHKDASVVVDIGEVLLEGQFLTDTLKVISLNSAILPSSVTSLSIGKGLLIGRGYTDELVFENKVVDTEISSDSNGKTKIEWEIVGNDADKRLFWDTVHQNGVDNDQTLANFLDRRTNKVGEPSASNLPRTVNPLKFLVDNFLRNVIIVEANFNTFGRNSLGFNNTNIVRRLIPPQYLLIFIVTISISEVSNRFPLQSESTTTFFTGAPNVIQSVSSTLIGNSSFTFS